MSVSPVAPPPRPRRARTEPIMPRRARRVASEPRLRPVPSLRYRLAGLLEARLQLLARLAGTLARLGQDRLGLVALGLELLDLLLQLPFRFAARLVRAGLQIADVRLPRAQLLRHAVRHHVVLFGHADTPSVMQVPATTSAAGRRSGVTLRRKRGRRSREPASSPHPAVVGRRRAGPPRGTNGTERRGAGA